MAKAIPLPSQERLHELLDYSIVEGNFYWRKSGRGRKTGEPAGALDKSTGYIRIHFDGIKYKAHRLAWMYITGEDPGELVIDHINGDKDNNGFHNLQLLTHKQNTRRKHSLQGGTSKHRGVSKKGNRWAARMRVDDVDLHLGYYDKEKDAAHVAYLYSHHVYHVGYSNYRMPL